jgi:hypothetical protein
MSNYKEVSLLILLLIIIYFFKDVITTLILLCIIMSISVLLIKTNCENSYSNDNQ